MSDRNDDDLSALLAKREHAKPNRLTWVLITVLVLLVGFVGGALANQKFGSSSGTSGFPSTGAFPAMGTFPGAGAAGTATIGTVKLVDGTSLYVTTTNGETVKVKVPPTVKVTAQQAVPLSELASGSTVIVHGDTGTDGTVTATTVSEASLPNTQDTTTGGN